MKKSLIMAPFNQYNDVVMDITKEVASDYDSICYITLNKTYRAMLNRITKVRLNPNRFYFIDMITPKVLEFDPAERCTFFEAFGKIDDFAENVITLVKSKKVKCVVFDSLSSFLVYKTDEEVIAFFNYINSFLEEMEVNLVIFALTEDAKRPSVKQIQMTVDKVRKW